MRTTSRWLLSSVLFLAMPFTSNSMAQNMFEPVSISQQQGWAQDNHAKALETFQRSCQEILTTAHGFKRAAKFGGLLEDWQSICQLALTTSEAKNFFEENFTALKVRDPDRPEGLYTGYYEPEAEGSLTERAEYSVPVYRKPHDLTSLDETGRAGTGLAYGRIVDGAAQAYYTRQEIESGALRGRGLEICWLKSWADAFFIHIQGSGRVKLPDGKIIRLAYAAKTGQPYSGIGGVLLAKGIGNKDTMSMEFLRNWLSENATEARALMWTNKSYIFFRQIEVPSTELGALGAQQINLTPLRSLAVDRSIWMFGTPIWINTTTPPEAGSKPFQHLMVAQDTGTAIKGHVRGDVYWGWGEQAAFNAGHMKSPGSMVVLLPKHIAERFK
jgi:membrane-bound lytic murein transglycosylase A